MERKSVERGVKEKDRADGTVTMSGDGGAAGETELEGRSGGRWRRGVEGE